MIERVDEVLFVMHIFVVLAFIVFFVWLIVDIGSLSIWFPSVLLMFEVSYAVYSDE